MCEVHDTAGVFVGMWLFANIHVFMYKCLLSSSVLVTGANIEPNG